MHDTHSERIVIVGSGLAGLSAAVKLVDAGYKPIVLEANHHLGGRTSSWIQDGMHIESGLHRFLGFYKALPELLEHVGIRIDDIVCWEDEIGIRRIGHQEHVLGLAPLHKPLKTLMSGLGHNSLIPPGDKASLGRMIAAGIRDYKNDPRALDRQTVYDYAISHGISDTAMHNLLIPLTEGIFALPVEKYSMHNLMGLLVPYLPRAFKTRVGAFMGGMSDVMIQPLARYIENAGGVLRTGSQVERLLIEDEKVTGMRLKSGDRIDADHVILATSLAAAQSIVRTSALGRHTTLQNTLLKLSTMPIVTFQIELSRPSMAVDRTTFGPGTILSSFAEQSRTTFRSSEGRLSIILSRPEENILKEPDEILRTIVREAPALGLDVSNNIIDYRMVRLPQDFYALSPGSEHLRPSQKTTVEGLTLAGDYTKQPYLATMEGAVVSGIQAAGVVVRTYDWVSRIA